jgi:hypothetical protein
MISGARFGEARYGDNDGGSEGAPELAAGVENNYAIGHLTWDSDLSNGCDAQVSIQLVTPNQNGAVQWTVDTVTITSPNTGAGNIGRVVVVAGALVPGSVSLTNLTAVFTKSGGGAYTYGPANGPTADENNSEAVLEITPPSTWTYTSVVVDATLRIQHSSEVYPGEGDLFAQVNALPPV